jgi:hypothetical protein
LPPHAVIIENRAGTKTSPLGLIDFPAVVDDTPGTLHREDLQEISEDSRVYGAATEHNARRGCYSRVFQDYSPIHVSSLLVDAGTPQKLCAFLKYAAGILQHIWAR